MKKFIKLSTYILAGVLTALGILSVVSFIISTTKGVVFTSYAIKGIISLFLVLIVGLTLFFVKKDVNSIIFYVVLGVTALIIILERFVFYGVMGFGSALFNLIKQGSALGAETALSILLILAMLYAFVIMFLSVMEKYTAKPVVKSKSKKR